MEQTIAELGGPIELNGLAGIIRGMRRMDGQDHITQNWLGAVQVEFE
jgi:hypothetical protein